MLSFLEHPDFLVSTLLTPTFLTALSLQLQPSSTLTFLTTSLTPLLATMTTDDLDFASRLILRVAQQTRYLVPWTALPFAAASLRIAELLHHLTSQTVHDVYFPFVRFSVLHAVRVSIAWAAMTRGRRGQVSVLADLFGFLVIACECRR